MTEDNAEAWCLENYPDKIEQLRHFVALLVDAARQQNLISASSIVSVWSRHVVDSAQLPHHAPSAWSHWVDIGSGAGLPGLVVGILTDARVTLIEPRRLRVEFLNRCTSALQLPNVTVIAAMADAARVDRADIVTARAVASLDKVFAMSQRFTDRKTRFILPKGVSAADDIANAKRSWHGRFHVKQSIVDPASGIVIASDVRPR